MNNFPFEYEGKTYWYSRSCAVTSFVFAKDKNNKWNILVNKRGPGTPDYQGCWNVPCGYLDFNEHCHEGAVRETFEETGLKISPAQMNFCGVNTSPSMNRQNVSFRFYTILDKTTDNYEFSKKNMEEGEVEEITWVPIEEIYQGKNPKFTCDRWAFEHYDLINEVFNNYVNISLFKKAVRFLYKKLFQEVYC